MLEAVTSDILNVKIVKLASRITRAKLIGRSVNSACNLSVIRCVQKVGSLDEALRKDLSTKRSVSTEGDTVIFCGTNIVSGMRWHEGAEGSV